MLLMILYCQLVEIFNPMSQFGNLCLRGLEFPFLTILLLQSSFRTRIFFYFFCQDKNAKMAQASKRYYQGQASLYLPACQCCYLMSNLVGGYLNPSQLEIPFSSEIPDIQKQGVYIPMPSLLWYSISEAH